MKTLTQTDLEVPRAICHYIPSTFRNYYSSLLFVRDNNNPKYNSDIYETFRKHIKDIERWRSKNRWVCAETMMNENDKIDQIKFLRFQQFFQSFQVPLRDSLYRI